MAKFSVNCTPDFSDHPKVINGASDLIEDENGVSTPKTDFIWALPLNAYPPSQYGTASVATADATLAAQPLPASVKKLLEILAQGRKGPAAPPAAAKPVKKPAKAEQ